MASVVIRSFLLVFWSSEKTESYSKQVDGISVGMDECWTDSICELFSSMNLDKLVLFHFYCMCYWKTSLLCTSCLLVTAFLCEPCILYCVFHLFFQYCIHSSIFLIQATMTSSHWIQPHHGASSRLVVVADCKAQILLLLFSSEKVSLLFAIDVWCGGREFFRLFLFLKILLSWSTLCNYVFFAQIWSI